MIDIIELLQQTLDNALQEVPLRSYWLLRQEIDDDPNPDEYIVYSAEEHAPDVGADGIGLIYRSYVTIRYFCREEWIGNADHLQTARKHMKLIREALAAAEFECTSGWNSVGDVDGISFRTFVLSAEYTEVDYGDE